MSKWIKRVLGLAAVGSAAAGLYYYLKNLLQITQMTIWMILRMRILISTTT